MAFAVKYRPDIDGLRAIAVIGVVFYHLQVAPFGGGFVGVDVFFVISGYLIAGIIHREIAQGRFTYAGFYARRIRRLFPALFAMLFAVLLVGAWLLLPSDLLRLGHASLATLLYGSNILFWRQSGYFDSGAEINPLLHTWSLAVEEQFYIVFPAILVIVHRYARARATTILLACALLSLGACIWLQALRPAATFYLSPFRGWEFLIGALAAVAPLRLPMKNWARESLAWIALVVMIGSLLLTPAGVDFPGWRPLVPALATVTLLLLGENGDTSVKRLLSLRPFVYVGLISYSLYLWHWPLLVAVRYTHDLKLPAAYTWPIFLAALALASASYHGVEKPFRFPKATSPEAVRRRTRRLAFLGPGLVAALALAVCVDSGWKFRFSTVVQALDSARYPDVPYQSCDGAPPDSGIKSIGCVIGDPSATVRALVWGDSHAMAWAPGLDEVLKKRHVTGVLALHSACPPLLNVDNRVALTCLKFNDRVFAWLEKHPVQSVFLIAAWPSYSSPSGMYVTENRSGTKGNDKVFPAALAEIISRLQSFSGKIVLFGDTPGAPSDFLFHAAMGSVNGKPQDATPKSLARVTEDAEYFWSAVRGLRDNAKLVVIDPTPWFCDARVCRYMSSDGSTPLYRDDGHLSLAGAHYAAARLEHVAGEQIGGDGVVQATFEANP
jgi:peptidoglycan/LPS O-acetylase OafA/YrhL